MKRSLSAWLQEKYDSTTLFLGFMYCLLYLPLVVVVVHSFNQAPYGFVWQGFSLEAYKKALQNVGLLKATFQSLELAMLAATCTSLLSTALAISLQLQFFGKSIIETSLLAAIMVPDVVLGLSLLSFFLWLQFPLGFLSLLLGHTLLCLPFALHIIQLALSSLDPSVTEAAKDLGANEWDLLWKIVLPQLVPAVALSWIISFTLSLDDVSVASFICGPEYELLPLKLCSMIRREVGTEVNALTSIMIGLNVIALWCIGKGFGNTALKSIQGGERA